MSWTSCQLLPCGKLDLTLLIAICFTLSRLHDDTTSTIPGVDTRWRIADDLCFSDTPVESSAWYASEGLLSGYRARLARV